VQQRAPQREPASSAESLAAALAPGASVRLRHGGLAVVEAAPERGHVRLRAGSMKLVVPLSEIDSVKAPAKATQRAAPARKTSSLPRVPAAAVRTLDNTLDLRGERQDDAIARVDAFLDQMLGEGHAVGFVLHGHGTGALKNAVREHLGASRYVANARPAEPDEGGDAYTVFWIAE